MAKEPTGASGEPFDIVKIRQLVRLMRDNDLSEIDLRWEDARICLRRGAQPSFMGAVPVSAPSAVPTAMTSDRPSEPAPSNEASADEQAARHVIVSPLVGTFYTAPSPDADPYVGVGSKVSAETIVCIVEAMKVFNEIPAGIGGTIRELLVENGAPVEYGQPLFRVEPD